MNVTPILCGHCLLSPLWPHILIATIWRLLTRHQLTGKHLQFLVAKEQNEELQGLQEADRAQYTDPDVFIPLDESTVET